jgi:hypothetical protein
VAIQVPKNGDFSQLVGSGENPRGFVSQTVNGTLVNGHGGDGYCHPSVMADGPRWNEDPRPGVPELWSMGMGIGSGAEAGQPAGAAYDVGATLPRRVKRK